MDPAGQYSMNPEGLEEGTNAAAAAAASLREPLLSAHEPAGRRSWWEQKPAPQQRRRGQDDYDYNCNNYHDEEYEYNNYDYDSDADNNSSLSSHISVLRDQDDDNRSSHSNGNNKYSRFLTSAPSSYRTPELSSTPSFQRCALFLGLLVGGFIQLSSLGANYLLSELLLAVREQEEEEEVLADSSARGGTTTTIDHNQGILIEFSLVWSVVTSLMGVCILLLVRALLRQIMTASTRRGDDDDDDDDGTSNTATTTYRSDNCKQSLLLLHLECYFAVGTLAGVCGAWTLTDLLLGFRNHVWHSLVTLVLALLWWKLVSRFVLRAATTSGSSTRYNRDGHDNSRHGKGEDDDTVDTDLILCTARDDDHDTDNDDYDSFVDRIVTTTTMTTATTTSAEASSFSSYVLCSLSLGLVVGFFIQFSSLGANFVLSNWQGSENRSGGKIPLLPDDKHVVAFSLAWSVLASAMGVLVLILARGLVCMVLQQQQPRQWEDSSESFPLPYKFLLRLEAFFAIGALLGVNAAWIGTDLVLGVSVHYLHSMWTEAMALFVIAYIVRCRLLETSNSRRR